MLLLLRYYSHILINCLKTVENTVNINYFNYHRTVYFFFVTMCAQRYLNNMHINPSYKASAISRGNSIRAITGGSGALNQLVFQNLDSTLFDEKFKTVRYSDLNEAAYREGPTLEDLCSSFAACKVRCANRKDPAKELMMKEVLLPGLDDSEYLPTDRARAAFGDDIRRSCRLEAGFSTFDNVDAELTNYVIVENTAIRAKTQDEVNDDLIIKYKHPMPSEVFDAYRSKEGQRKFVTDSDWSKMGWRSLEWACGVVGYTKSRDLVRGVKEAFFEFVVSASKQGNISPAKLNKIVGSLGASGQLYTQIDSKRINTIGIIFQSYYNENCLKFLYKVWLDKIDDISSSLRTVLVQAKGQGLTTLKIIVEVLKEYPDFPWHRLLRVVSRSEFTAVERAIEACRGRPFAGFDARTMELYGVKHYRNIGYICKKILIVVAGEESYTDYRGLPATHRYDLKINDVINEYKASTEPTLINDGDEEKDEAVRFITDHFTFEPHALNQVGEEIIVNGDRDDGDDDNGGDDEDRGDDNGEDGGEGN